MLRRLVTTGLRTRISRLKTSRKILATTSRKLSDAVGGQ